LIERDAEQECAEEPAAKADAGIKTDRRPSVPRGGDGEDTRSEVGEVSLHGEANDDRQPYDRDVRQHRGEAEQAARDRRQQEDKGSDVAQAVADRQLVAEKTGGDAEETDQRTDCQHDPGLRGSTGLIRGTEREKDDDPLPQSDRTPDRRGIPKDQDEGIAIAENRSNVEDRARLLGDSWIRPRQCSPRNEDTGGTDDSGENKSASPTPNRTAR
jgi:hypothetical protein